LSNFHAEIAHFIQGIKTITNELGSNVGVHASFIYEKNQNKEK
jgi:hypothetical protein